MENRQQMMEGMQADLALLEASREGDADAAKAALSRGASWDASVMGWTPARIASSRGEVAFMRGLGGLGLDWSQHGFDSLAAAAAKDQVDALDFLLDIGVPADALDSRGELPLAMAARLGQTRTLERLLGRGALVGARGKRGLQALHEAALEGRLDALRMLLNAGADVHARAAEGLDALMFAARHGQKQCLEELVRAGADLAALDPQGRGGAWLAASGLAPGCEDCLRSLGALGAPLNVAAKDGSTPLDRARTLASQARAGWIESELARRELESEVGSGRAKAPGRI